MLLVHYKDKEYEFIDVINKNKRDSTQTERFNRKDMIVYETKNDGFKGIQFINDSYGSAFFSFLDYEIKLGPEIKRKEEQQPSHICFTSEQMRQLEKQMGIGFDTGLNKWVKTNSQEQQMMETMSSLQKMFESRNKKTPKQLTEEYITALKETEEYRKEKQYFDYESRVKYFGYDMKHNFFYNVDKLDSKDQLILDEKPKKCDKCGK